MKITIKKSEIYTDKIEIHISFVIFHLLYYQSSLINFYKNFIQMHK